MGRGKQNNEELYENPTFQPRSKSAQHALHGFEGHVAFETSEVFYP